ncbi:2-oxoacid:acceptor oxidoreductase family protein [Maridesulfovibrio zosterae]|uniref:2-oxoacid:acceptor oxidoreductase family protein n=1 Tax=Maridesulfovibrio zosterae TaxID=82171 RepID=UPI00040265AE
MNTTQQMNPIKQMCTAPSGQPEVLQGNIAFAVGCVRAGIHCADGYPGTPSSEVIDKGLSQVQDMIKVGWSVSEAVAVGVGFGHTLAGEDCVVTMKIPGLMQAGDVVTSASFFTQDRGALIYYVATDFTPSSTQHVLDPRYLFKSCFLPVFEPRDHQEMHEAASIAVEIGRKYNTSVVILPSGMLCHSEGLVRFMDEQSREPVAMPESLHAYNCLPGMTRKNYNTMMDKRMPELVKMVEESPLNQWIKGSGKRGVIVYGPNTMYMKEVKALYEPDIDILSLGFTNPLPMNLIKQFCESIEGEVFVLDDGFHYVQEEIERKGIKVTGKPEYTHLTEWDPAAIAEFLGHTIEKCGSKTQPLMRPPMICAGCPYRLFGEIASSMLKKKDIEAIFGDIGCNSLLYFMNALDTGVAMGASENKRCGYVLSNPEKASKCISVIGDSCECHSGMDGTRNSAFRNAAGVKIILDNEWTAMTGGQPSASSPVNLAGEPTIFNLAEAVRTQGTDVVEVSGYDYKGIRKSMKNALKAAEEGKFTTVIIQGTCIRKVPKDRYGQKLIVDAEKCKKCGMCNICPGISVDEEGIPEFTNLCTGCVSETPACMQRCAVGAISIDETPAEKIKSSVTIPVAPEAIETPSYDKNILPRRLSVAVRGVGGQGNLFFGRVLTKLAFLSGYSDSNVVKGETHGMAQMGGPVISTFACGESLSPVLVPGSVDCLVSMEMSEVFRPGFVELLKPNGTVVLAKTSILPPGMNISDYPSEELIKTELADYNVVFVDVLQQALNLGDPTGRCANVVMMGAMSKIAPFNVFPDEFWLMALKGVSPKPVIWNTNYAAFLAGTTLL